MATKKDYNYLKNEKSGRLSFIEDLGMINKKHCIKCICDCGNEKIIKANKWMRIFSCGCILKEINESKRPNFNSVSGKKFGSLTVVKDAGRIKVGGIYKPSVLCKCDCGSDKKIAYNQLGKVKSCGCIKGRNLLIKQAVQILKIKGKKIHSLTYLEEVEPILNGNIRDRRVLCRCDCGNLTTILWSNRGRTKTCGCIIKRKGKDCQFYKHGASNTRLINIWNNMKSRCDNPKHRDYSDYGGRGIDVCREWYLFTTFQGWAMNNGYNENLTIERNDVNKGYSPENCRWATKKEQAWNKRNTVRLEYNGLVEPIIFWVNIIGGNKLQTERRLSDRFHRKKNFNEIFSGYEETLDNYFNVNNVSSG